MTVCHEWRHPLPVVGEPLAALIGALWVRPLTQATLTGLAKQRTDAAAYVAAHGGLDGAQLAFAAGIG